MEKNGEDLTTEELKEKHIRILELVHDPVDRSNKDIGRKIGLKRSAVSKHLRDLRRGGFIETERGRTNTHTLLERGETALRGAGRLFKFRDRAHDILFKFSIGEGPGGRIAADDTEVAWRNGLRQSTIKSDRDTIQLHGTESITILVKEVWADSPEGAVVRAFQQAEKRLLSLIEECPQIELERGVKGEILKQSHAIPDDALAELCFRFGIHIQNHESGIEIDASHGRPEIEFTDPQRAPEDYRRYRKQIESIAEGDNDH